MNCKCCGAEVKNADTNLRNIFCEDCFLTHGKSTCEFCGEQTIDDWMEEVETYDGYEVICPFCSKEKRNRYNHDYKPYPIFHSMLNASRKDCLHVGIELELEGTFETKYTDFISDMDNIGEDYFYAKVDGSLDEDNGYEIVSHPMTLPIALEKWRKAFQIIDKHKMKSNTYCGLHIHLDKEYLNQRQITNIDYIINTFYKTIKKLGGRDITNNTWAAQLLKTANDWGKITDRDYKYRAVHFCENTIELRCFNSTDDWFTFRWILICMFALVEYAKIHNLSFFQHKTDEKFEMSFFNFVNKFKSINAI